MTLDRMLEPLSEALLSTAMVTPEQTEDLLRHAAGFPALPAHRLFLEFRVGQTLVLEGYGHGYAAGTLGSLLRSGVDFTAADRLGEALAMDPFAEDRRRFVDIGADTDPDWIEYDHARGRFSDAPGVFYSFPARFRVASSRQRARALEARLNALLCRPAGGGITFWDLLDALMRAAPDGVPIGLYRLGLCTGRRRDWVRVVLNNLSRDTLEPLGELGPVQIGWDPVGWIVDELAALGVADPQIAASVTMVRGVVEAIDFECPFFNRIADDRQRRVTATAFCRVLASRGVVAPSVAETLARSAVVEIEPPHAEVRGQLLLNHLKFGVAGSTCGRVKAYFELLLRAGD